MKGLLETASRDNESMEAAATSTGTTEVPGLRSPIDRATLAGLLGLIALCITGCFTMLGNWYSQDETAIILGDKALHAFSLQRIFLEPYWPAPFDRDLYRPLSSLLFATEWQMGQGSPLTFRLVSLTLYILGVIACFALARRILPGKFAWAVAAIFAIHPVHVEAVALGVNQSELLVGLILCLTTAWYIERRRDAEPLSWREHGALAALILIGGFFKEQAVVLPGLLALVEVLLFPAGDSVLRRLVRLWKMFLLSSCALILVLLPRAILFSGNLGGSFTAETFHGLTRVERWYTMLEVVPRWVQLMFWPAHLQADYSIQEIAQAHSFGMMQAAGALVLLLIVWLALRAARSLPAISFGIGFAALTILPVSNFLFPTGIVLAERTLYAPSIGAMLALGATAWALSRMAPESVTLKALGALGLALLLVAGTVRSLNRYQVWKNPLAQAISMAQDSPLSYRTWLALGGIYLERGDTEEGRRMIKTGLELWPGSSRGNLMLAESYRFSDDCDSAVIYYREGLARAEVWGTDMAKLGSVRASLISCLVWLGEYDEARELAAWERDNGNKRRVARTWLWLVDSAQAINAPPGTIRFPVDSVEKE